VLGRSGALALRRAAPLTATEREALAEVARGLREHPFTALQSVELLILEDWTPWRAALRWTVAAVDRGLREHAALAGFARAAAEAAGEPLADDPCAALGLVDGQLVCDPKAPPVPALPEGWAPPPAVARSPSPPPPAPPVARVGSPEELADLLHVLRVVGPAPDLLAAGVAQAAADPRVLIRWTEDGVLPDGCLALLGALHARDLGSPEGLRALAGRRWADGDRQERAAAAAIISALRARGGRPPVGPSDPRSPTGLGLELLQALDPDGWADALPEAELLDDADDEADDDDAEAAPTDAEESGIPPTGEALDRSRAHPGVPPPTGPADGSGGPPSRPGDPEDEDIDLDDLFDGEPPAEPAQTFAALAPPPGAAPPAEPGPDAVAALLDGPPDGAAGAALLIAAGAWSAAEVPGLVARLAAWTAPDRPWPLRAVCAAALGPTQRPDALPRLLDLARDADARVAGLALRGLSAWPGAVARRAVREALDRPGVAAAAADAVRAAGDAGAALALRGVAVRGDPDAARAAMQALAALGGPIDRRDLERLAGAQRAPLARFRGADEVRGWLQEGGEDLPALLAAVADADRVDLWADVRACADHPSPEVQQATAEALGALRLRAATPALVRLATAPDPGVGVAALDALGACGDRRAVATLRRLALRGDARGRAARRALQAGGSLRAPPPDGRLRLKVMSRALLGPDDQRHISAAFQGLPVALRFSAAGLSAEGQLADDDPSVLAPLVQALQEASGLVPGLAWSVRDGHTAVRRAQGRWVLSGAHGLPARDAGWFAEPLPAAWERPALSPADDPEGGPPVA